MQTVTQLTRDALLVSHKKHQTITVTPPGGVTTELMWDSASVSSSGDSGARYQARVDVKPQPGVDLYSILSTPGAIFRITDGIDFGGLVDSWPLGVYEAVSGSINIIDGDISMSLVDQWAAVEEARFSAPYTPDTGIWTTRAEFIAAAVTEAVPDVDVVIEDDGGNYTVTDRVWDRDRTQFINDLATDGGLDVYFNAAGEFVIRKQPIVNPTASVWTFRTGDAAGTILTAERERDFSRHYNRVVINPIDSADETTPGQTWFATTFDIEDTTNPLHRDNLGRVVPYFYSSPTLMTEEAVNNAGNTLLQRVQGMPETLSLGAIGAPLEVGDTVTVVHPRTPSDPGFNAVHIIDSWDYDMASGAMTAKTRSSDLVELTES